MQTKNIIQSQANVIKITSLKKGDTLKLIKKEYSDSYSTYYGVVLDLLNSGTKSFIQILEYEKSYGEVKTKIKTYSGEDDLTVFPATPDEVKDYMSGTVEYLEDEIEKTKKQLQEKIESLEKAKEFMSGELSKKLSTPEYSEITQSEFEAKRQEFLD
jgi:hypothetical protein